MNYSIGSICNFLSGLIWVLLTCISDFLRGRFWISEDVANLLSYRVAAVAYIARSHFGTLWRFQFYLYLPILHTSKGPTSLLVCIWSWSQSSCYIRAFQSIFSSNLPPLSVLSPIQCSVYRRITEFGNADYIHHHVVATSIVTRVLLSRVRLCLCNINSQHTMN